MQAEISLKIDEYQLRYARIMCISVAFLYPFIGHVLLMIDNSAIEYLSHRYLIGLCLILLVVSTYFSVFFRKYCLYGLYSCITGGLFWIIWIVDVNDFSLNYLALLIAAIGASATMFLHWRLLVVFLMLTSIVLFITIHQNSEAVFNPYISIFACLILGVVLLINNSYKDTIRNEIYILNQQLGRYNQDLENEVQERTKLLKKKNDELENYTYLVSHDLKSPLTNASSFAKLLDKELLNKDYENLGHHIGIINQSVDRMASILNDLLIYGKIGMTESNYEDIDLHVLFDDIIVSSFSAEIENGAVIEINSKLPKVINGDRQQLSLLFQNLISNGLKYNNSKQKVIHINGEKTKNRIAISISDNGIGFIAKESTKIFDMFRRLHTKDDYEKTGIGLSICKRIAENHNGKLKAFSDLGQGSRFEFSIAR